MLRMLVALPIALFGLMAFSLSAQNFRVQVAAFADSVPASYFSDRGLNGVAVSVDDAGMYRYLFGSYPTYIEAEDVQKQLLLKGFEYATVIDLERQRVLTDRSSCAYFKGGPVEVAESDSVRFIYFDLGQSRLPEKELPDLDYMLGKLKDAPGSQLRILGYTDAVGTGVANLELATTRARTVRNYMIDRGVDPGRMLLRVFGESVAGGIEEEEYTRESELEELRKLYRCVVIYWKKDAQ